MDERIGGLESQFGELRERMAHLEGLLEGLREASPGGRQLAKDGNLAYRGGVRVWPTS